MKRSEKEKYIEQLRDDLSASQIVVVARQGGLTVADMTSLRSKMRAAGGSMKVVKNTLAKRAVEGSKFEGMASSFAGPVILGYSQDPVAAAKVLVEFADGSERVEVVAGNLNGQALEQSSVVSLAKLPSLDELRAKILGVLVAPASKIARVLQAPGGQVARVLAAHAEKS